MFNLMNWYENNTLQFHFLANPSSIQKFPFERRWVEYTAERWSTLFQWVVDSRIKFKWKNTVYTKVLCFVHTQRNLSAKHWQTHAFYDASNLRLQQWCLQGSCKVTA